MKTSQVREASVLLEGLSKIAEERADLAGPKFNDSPSVEVSEIYLPLQAWREILSAAEAIVRLRLRELGVEVES